MPYILQIRRVAAGGVPKNRVNDLIRLSLLTVFMIGAPALASWLVSRTLVHP
jgi:hypothetical protein